MGEDRSTSKMSRYTVAEAADMLGITTGAVRNRLSRGTLTKVKAGGTVYVLLPAGMSRDTERDADDTPPGMSHGEPDALMSEMRNRIAFLEQEMEAWREESRRKDTIIMNMTEAMKAISPPAEEEPSEARELPNSPDTTPTGQADEDEPTSARRVAETVTGGVLIQLLVTVAPLVVGSVVTIFAALNAALWLALLTTATTVVFTLTVTMWTYRRSTERLRREIAAGRGSGNRPSPMQDRE
jgi:hypothetical protein